jgi:uncharacterized paraquat-inducible protein A
MRYSIPEISHKSGEFVSEWVRRQTHRTLLCRECDLEVNIAESACPRCGASDPVRIPWSAATAIFALSACVIIAAIMFFG